MRNDRSGDLAVDGIDTVKQEQWGANNFGIIRLVLAIAVIVGHTPELIDGNRSREPLTVLFGVLSLGEVAVDGFFLISGYLLTASLLSKPLLRRYFINRVTRIYPGFIVAFSICVLLVAPLAGSFPIVPTLVPNAIRAILLQPPQVQGAFTGAAEPALDGAMWTISYEFCCYIMLAFLFRVGIVKRRWALLSVVGLVVIVLLLRLRLDITHRHLMLGASPQSSVRFASAFLFGALIKRTVTVQRLHPLIPVACVAIVLASLGNYWLAEPALIVFGGIALLWAAERPFSRIVSGIGVNQDVSYGVYLYAWPIQNLLIWRAGLVDPASVTCITVAGAVTIGFLSWTLVENPAMQFGRYLLASRRTSPA